MGARIPFTSKIDAVYARVVGVGVYPYIDGRGRKLDGKYLRRVMRPAPIPGLIK
jgi:hypothetical protein